MPVTINNEIAVAPATDLQATEAKNLATELGLQMTSLDNTSYPLLLVKTGERLELRRTGAGKTGPVYVDFTGGRADHRRREGGGKKQTIARAVGIKGQYLPTVLDATAGLGRDAFVLACLGCRVTMCEQNPVLGALLKDGLARAANNSQLSAIINKNMFFQHGDSLEIMSRISQENRPEVVYLDPMFPHRTKSALVKKEMQVIQQLVGEDLISDQLLTLALNTATRRVAVKRPASAPPLNGRRPDLTYETKKNRFDVYLIH
ncbi:MAG: class I SAM-dependent methyltransferase [Proteobacteria bacterium]|nr:class I SAM-dependent methyltransferase [Pseudomonadota bacterium]MBU1738117.1 class I SAM-dependent methyltransferase [Pseudomonadota bacterium]